MVFKSYEKILNCKKEELVVQCDCETHSFHIVSFVDEPEYYFSLWTQDFYSYQDKSFIKRLKRKLKAIWLILIGKGYKLSELYLTGDDIERLILTLQEMQRNKGVEEK